MYAKDSQKNRNKREADALAAAEVIFPRLVQSFVEAGLKPDAVREVFDRAMSHCRDEAFPPRPAQSRQDLADLAHVLSVWHMDPRFVDKNGQPRALRAKGRTPSFERLVGLANPAVPADAVLKGLLISGAAEIDANGKVRALRREFVSKGWDELGLWQWQQTVRRLLETLEFNYSMPGTGRFERTARSERLPVRLLPVFDRWVREHAGEFLRMTDDWLTQHEDSAHSQAENSSSVTTGVGVYLFVDEPNQ